MTSETIAFMEWIMIHISELMTCSFSDFYILDMNFGW